MENKTKPGSELKKDVDSTKKLSEDLTEIKTEKKRKTILQKIKDILLGSSSKEYPWPKKQPDDLNRTSRQRALDNFEDENGMLRGDAWQHRMEEDRINAERRAAGEINAIDADNIYKKELRARATAELEEEHIYVKGGQQAIEAKMAEIEARDKANAENSDTFEKV
jgi:hypothetical protein